MGAFLAVELKTQGTKDALGLSAGERSMLAPHKVPTPGEAGEAGKDAGSRSDPLRLHGGEPEVPSRGETAANRADSARRLSRYSA